MDMKHKVMDGSEPFEFRGAPLPSSVKDFWAWSMSRLIADGPRGDLAEFIVNTALGMDMTEPKRGWGECDIVYPHGGKPVRIEVKCSTLLQAWERPSPPKPVFSIAKTLNCDIEDTGERLPIHRPGRLPAQAPLRHLCVLPVRRGRPIPGKSDGAGSMAVLRRSHRSHRRAAWRPAQDLAPGPVPHRSYRVQL